jgi:hypothetical protein
MTNSASPAEKLAQLHNQRLLRQGDQPAPSTLFAQSQVGRRLDGSTNYEATRDLIQAGEGLVVEYPRLPASSPWSGVGPQVPNEEPLGVAIDQQECTGTAAEVAASLDELATETAPANSSNKPDDELAERFGGHPTSAVSPPAEVVAPPDAPLPASSPGRVERGGATIKRRKV